MALVPPKHHQQHHLLKSTVTAGASIILLLLRINSKQSYLYLFRIYKSIMDFYRYVQEDERTIEAAWQKDLNTPLLKGHVQLRNIPRLIPTCARIYFMSMFTGESWKF